MSDPVLTLSAPSANINTSLTEAIYALQTEGLTDVRSERWALACVTVATHERESIESTVDAVKSRLDDTGYMGRTVDDILGQFRAFFDAILLILTGFAAITLVAGSLGIVNTLFMSVQERTSEIGLLKALGMTCRQVFAVFSLEAVVIGVLSAVVGLAVLAIASGPVNSRLAGGPLADLPGLNLITFTPGIIVGVPMVILTIAFLPGSIPATRAANKDPINTLRHE